MSDLIRREDVVRAKGKFTGQTCRTCVDYCNFELKELHENTKDDIHDP